VAGPSKAPIGFVYAGLAYKDDVYTAYWCSFVGDLCKGVHSRKPAQQAIVSSPYRAK
jgi:hypothetical protein